MPGMLVTQPTGRFPELGAFLLRDWKVMLTGEEQILPGCPQGELGTALCRLSPG